MPIKIDKSRKTYFLVIRRRDGKVYASAFTPDLSDKQIESRIWSGDAAFFPYDEKKGEIQPWKTSKIVYFRR